MAISLPTLRKKSAPLAESAPAVTADDLRARWRAEVEEEAAVIAKGGDVLALILARADRALAGPPWRELALLEVMLDDRTGERKLAATEILGSTDDALIPMTHDERVALYRAIHDEPREITLTVERRNGDGLRIREPRTVNYAAKATHLIRFADLYRGRRAEARAQRVVGDELALAVESALVRVVDELNRTGLWSRLAVGDPMVISWLKSPDGVRWLAPFAPIGGWHGPGIAARLIDQARGR